MLASILAGPIVKLLFGAVQGIFKDYFNKEISKAEAEARIKVAVSDSIAKVEKSHADALASSYESFWKHGSKSSIVMWCWSAATISQLFALFWYQWIVPFGAWMDWWTNYPSPGETISWAYLLLGGLLGMAPLVLRSGPGKLK